MITVVGGETTVVVIGLGYRASSNTTQPQPENIVQTKTVAADIKAIFIFFSLVVKMG